MSCASAGPYNLSWLTLNGKNKSMNGPVKKSTTLFPMRVKEVSNAVNDLGVTDRHIHMNGSSGKDRELSKVNKDCSPFPSMKIPSVTAVNSDKDPLGSAGIECASSLQSSSALLKKHERENTTSHIPRYVKCFICERIIKEDHFSEHLLFGSVKCSLCNVVFRDCQGFQLWATQFALGNLSCKHKFYYLTKPAKYLTNKLSVRHMENSSENFKILLLKNYINKLKSLEKKRPWQQAISECKDIVSGEKSLHGSEEEREMMDLDKDRFGISKGSVFKASTNYINDEGYESSKIQEEYIEDDFAQYDLDHLEKATEFVKVPETLSIADSATEFVEMPEAFSTVDSPSSRFMLSKDSATKKLKTRIENAVPDQTDDDEKRKTRIENTGPYQTDSVGDKRKTTTESAEPDQTGPDNDSLELLPIPSDGFYYVSTEPIEECPNCYERLCPSQFTVNVLTFLMTVVCVGCDLTIYITSGAPEVQIVTDGMEKTEPCMAESIVNYDPPVKNKSRKRGRPRKYPKLF